MIVSPKNFWRTFAKQRGTMNNNTPLSGVTDANENLQTQRCDLSENTNSNTQVLPQMSADGNANYVVQPPLSVPQPQIDATRTEEAIGKEVEAERKANEKFYNRPLDKEQRKGQRLLKRMIRSGRKKEQKYPPEIRLQKKLEAIANLQCNNKRWYKLDNAALMYPLVARGESISVFRVSALLKDPVDPVQLQYAVNEIAPRFPTICGSVKNGLFWPYIERPAIPITVKPQTKVPGRPIKVDGRRSQVRINYIGNQISVEFFHSATDGTGGIIFLNSLLRRYFQRTGHPVDDRTNCYDFRDLPNSDEIRDNFAKVAVKRNPPPCPKPIKVSPIKGDLYKNRKYVTVRGICSAKQLKEVAHRHNATVTEYLGALQLLALDRLATVTNSPQKRPIRVMIPVNLRKVYNVETIRNFSSYIFYQYSGQTDIDEIIADIKKQTAEQLTDDYFRGMVSFNYNSGNSPILKIVPLAVKRAILSLIVSRQGDGIVNNSTLSNLGLIKAPKEFAELVVRYDFMLGKPARRTNNFTVATYNDVCVIAITNPFSEKDCERLFFRELAKSGIDIAVESDIWEDAE